MPGSDAHLARARAVTAEAEEMREVAGSLEQQAEPLGTQLDLSREMFTSEVWESVVAEQRFGHLQLLDRSLKRARDDIIDVAEQLRRGATERDTEAEYQWARYAAELLLELESLGAQ